VSVVVKQRAKARVHHLSRSLKKLGRSVGRKNQRSIAQQCMNDSKIKKRIIQITGQYVYKEMKAMAGLSYPTAKFHPREVTVFLMGRSS